MSTIRNTAWIAGKTDFGRMKFLTENALPLQKHLNGMIREMGLDTAAPGMLRYDAPHMFSPGALQPADSVRDEGLFAKRAALGKKLFFERRLSGDSSKSCASCQNPALYFTDGLPKSMGIKAHAIGRRNAPSLFYAAAQHTQFWDGRAKTILEGGEDHYFETAPTPGTKGKYRFGVLGDCGTNSATGDALV
ncbi:cytochrome-c peroxidase [Dyadobacter alkalitolerans]|uniref:cytochrome-c peroxidase n=1 Tax=Dyadobacter alkalitolerans TaxID=492736 RepID=UPI00146FB829|nr:cytochrome-c peroxidase [Dyadobacter alkalitolerans]